jgi:CRP-like cAMP-binding protein
MLKNDDLQLKIFDGFSHDELDELKSIIETLHFAAGDTILRQNQQAVHLFIVVCGEVEIHHVPYDGPSLSIGKLSSGSVFGWSSILGRKVYSSSVIVTADCQVYRIPAYKLQRFCEHHHESGVVLLEKIATSVAQQPARIHDQIMQMIRYTMACREENTLEE